MGTPRIRFWSVYGLFAGDICFYVGATSQNPDLRLKGHLSHARKGRTYQRVFERIRDYLSQNIIPHLQVWETLPTKVLALAREEFLTRYIRDYAGVDLANEQAGNRPSLQQRKKSAKSLITRSHHKSTSGEQGVSRWGTSGKWRARLSGKHLGLFDTVAEALAARVAAQVLKMEA